MNVEDVLPRDAIPSIDDPSFDTAYFGKPGDRVVLVHDDPPRAYPLRILSHHEIVNDEAKGTPIAVTWCPICWSAAVYERRVADRTLTFGVSGDLAGDALVMYDRETNSKWHQPTGRAIGGPLEGQRLDARPAPMTTWEQFRRDNPTGAVLQPVRGGPRASDEALRAVYDMDRFRDYATGEEFGLYGMRGEGEPREWTRTDLDPKDVVLGLERQGESAAVPRRRVEEAGDVRRVVIGGDEILVIATDASLHAFEAPGFDLEMDEGTLVGDGTTWDPVTGESVDGRSLEPVSGRQQFAFAWQAAHGPDAFR